MNVSCECVKVEKTVLRAMITELDATLLESSPSSSLMAHWFAEFKCVREELDMSNCPAPWLPRLLTPDQNGNRLSVS